MELRGTVVPVAPRSDAPIRDNFGCDTWLAYTDVRRVECIRLASNTRAKPQHNERGVRDILDLVAVERRRRVG